MTRKIFGKTITGIVALVLVFGLCMSVALAADNGSVSVVSGGAKGGIGRTVKIKLTAPKAAGDWDVAISGISSGTINPNVTDIQSGSEKEVDYIAPDTATTETMSVKYTNKVDSSISHTATLKLETVAPSMTINPTSGTYSTSGNTISVTVSNPAVNGKVTVSSPGSVSGSGSSYSVLLTDAGTYTIEYKNDDESTTYDSKTVQIRKKDPSISASETTITMYKNDTKQVVINTDSDYSGDINATSSASSKATAAVSGKTITITGVDVGTATIVASIPASTNYNASGSATITVNVLDPSSPMITVSPSSVALNKSNTSQTVTITVKNPKVESDGKALVNVKISKPSSGYKGVYIDDSRVKGGITFSVPVSGSTATFTIKLKPRYSGTYTLQATNGSMKGTGTVTVTGYSALPGTGPDYSMVYIFAALLAIALGGIVLVNVLKRKNGNGQIE